MRIVKRAAVLAALAIAVVYLLDATIVSERATSRSDTVPATGPRAEPVQHADGPTDAADTSRPARQPGQGGCGAVGRRLRAAPDARLPADVVVHLVRCHCETAITLSPEELERLGALLLENAPLQARDVLDAIGDAHAGCVLDILARWPDALTGRAWGRALSQAGAMMEGGILKADARLIEVALRLVEAHPPNDLAWWKPLWSAWSETTGAVHARRAIYEAVATLPPSERLLAWQGLAGLEDVARSGKASAALMTLGFTMSDHVDTRASLQSIAQSENPNWRRALLWSLKDEGLWPRRAEPLDPAVARSLVDALRQRPQGPEEKLWRLSLIGRSWSVLGPTLAAEEFAEFAAAPGRRTSEAAWRITVVSYEVAQNEDSESPEAQAAFDRAEGVLADLLARRAFDLDALLGQVLRSGKMDDRGARDVITRALGPRIHDLDKSVYAKLVR